MDLSVLYPEYEEIVTDILTNGIKGKNMQRENNEIVTEILNHIKEYTQQSTYTDF